MIRVSRGVRMVEKLGMVSSGGVFWENREEIGICECNIYIVRWRILRKSESFGKFRNRKSSENREN